MKRAAIAQSIIQLGRFEWRMENGEWIIHVEILADFFDLIGRRL
jgi:hypothetical protein